jgi:MFS family permease
MAQEHKIPPVAIPSGVWALGFVSLLMDVSSEMIHALLPVYLVSVFATPMVLVGLIEGIAEATAAVTKVFSGALSDWLGRRKLLAAIGYGLAAFSKPVFPLAEAVGWLVAARFVDRVGKGIRGAPRDALVADLAPPEIRGAAFGLRQTLDTVGAFAGPLAAMLFMWLTFNSFQTVFWIAVIPAFLSFALIVFAVRDPHHVSERKRVAFPLQRKQIGQLGQAFWLVTLVAIAFTLARFSEAFLVLRAQGLGLALFMVPLVLVVMNAVYALSAYPAGRLSDRMDRIGILALGLVVLIVAYGLLAFAPSLAAAFAGAGLFGLHMGLTQGILAALVADTAPAELRGTAFGLFNLTTGLALLLASVLAGWFWDAIGPQATFGAGAGFAALALIRLAMIRRRFRAAQSG